MFHISPGQADNTWYGFASAAGGVVQCNNSGIVNQTVGTAQTGQTTIGGANYYASGVLMAQPVVDDTPYRVKAYVLSLMYAYLYVGYAPANPTGNGDTIEKCVFMPITARTEGPHAAMFDDIINFPGVPESDPYYQRPVSFGIVARSFSNHDAAFNISVQNLAKTAPQFAASMS